MNESEPFARNFASSLKSRLADGAANLARAHHLELVEPTLDRSLDDPCVNIRPICVAL
jgi:hypothetical protein